MVAILAALDRASWLLLMGREGRAAPTHSRALPQLLRGLMSPPRRRRLLAFIPQEWFLKTHVIIESEASGVVSAIYDAGQAIAANDVDRLLAMLRAFAERQALGLSRPCAGRWAPARASAATTSAALAAHAATTPSVPSVDLLE